MDFIRLFFKPFWLRFSLIAYVIWWVGAWQDFLTTGKHLDDVLWDSVILLIFIVGRLIDMRHERKSAKPQTDA